MIYRHTLFSLFLVALGTGARIEAQDNDAHSATGPASGQVSPALAFQSGGAYLGNFLQAPKGSDQENIFMGTGRITLDYPVSGRTLTLSGSVGGDLYQGYDPSLRLSLESRWSPDIHRLEAHASYRTRSPRGEVGDSIGWADVLMASLSYKIRPLRSIQLEALTEMDRQAYNRLTDRDNHALRLGGALRFFGLGYLLSPELGAASGVRNVKDEKEDYDERTWWLTVRSIPASPIYLNLRYRNRRRNYTVGLEDKSGNLGREDDRSDVTLSAEVDLGSRWSWTLYFSFQQAESSKPSRNFDSQYLWSGLTYTFGGTPASGSNSP